MYDVRHKGHVMQLNIKPRQRREAGRTSVVTVRLENDLVQAIDEIARENHATRTAVVTALLERQQKFLRARGGAA